MNAPEPHAISLSFGRDRVEVGLGWARSRGPSSLSHLALGGDEDDGRPAAIGDG